MRIGYVIKIVSENNQNMIECQNYETHYNKHPKIMCSLDKIIKFMIFSTRSPFKIKFHWVYIIQIQTHYNLFMIFSKFTFSLLRPFVTIFNSYFTRIFFVMIPRMIPQTSYGYRLPCDSRDHSIVGTIQPCTSL